MNYDYSRPHHVVLGDRSAIGDFLYTDIFVAIKKKFNDNLRPICLIAEQTEIAKRLFRTAELQLSFRQLVGELYQEFPVAFTLVLREGEDTRQVVVFARLFFFGKVPDQVTAMRVVGGLIK
jgi:hypothetical protein